MVKVKKIISVLRIAGWHVRCHGSYPQQRGPVMQWDFYYTRAHGRTGAMTLLPLTVGADIALQQALAGKPIPYPRQRLGAQLLPKSRIDPWWQRQRDVG